MPDIGNIPVKAPAGQKNDTLTVGPIVVFAVILAVIIGLTAFWFLGRESEETTAQSESVVEMPEPREITPPAPVEPEPSGLPELNDSDSFIRNLVATLSAHPGFTEWLVSEDLIRSFVVTVDNIADGRNPAQHLPFMRPTERFSVSGVEPTMRVDSHSYRRYDNHAQIIDSLDTTGIAQLFVQLEPLINEAYGELGYPDTPFRATLERAITHLQETPVIDGPPLLRLGAAFYEYVDDSLDNLTPAQKQFLGMGRNNVQTVQNKLSAINTAINLLNNG
jgi:hypothetical protein